MSLEPVSYYSVDASEPAMEGVFLCKVSHGSDCFAALESAHVQCTFVSSSLDFLLALPSRALPSHAVLAAELDPRFL
jgi:hypothetical protein